MEILSQVSLHDYRSFTDATITFEPVTCFVGANESGKTNLLEAMCCFSLDTNFKPEDISKSRRRRYKRQQLPTVSFTFHLTQDDREKLAPLVSQASEWEIIRIDKKEDRRT